MASSPSWEFSPGDADSQGRYVGVARENGQDMAFVAIHPDGGVSIQMLYWPRLPVGVWQRFVEYVREVHAEQDDAKRTPLTDDQRARMFDTDAYQQVR